MPTYVHVVESSKIVVTNRDFMALSLTPKSAHKHLTMVMTSMKGNCNVEWITQSLATCSWFSPSDYKPKPIPNQLQFQKAVAILPDPAK